MKKCVVNRMVIRWLTMVNRSKLLNIHMRNQILSPLLLIVHMPNQIRSPLLLVLQSIVHMEELPFVLLPEWIE